MRRGAVVALNVALLVGLASVTRAAEPDGDANAAAPQSGGWLTRWFTFGKKPQDKKAAAKAKEAPAPSKTMLLETAARQRAQEEAALLRRQAVCLKLRMIAAQTSDEELRRKADQLDERAWNSYVQRTAHLPTGNASPASDEAILNRHLGTAAGSAGAASANTRGVGSSGRAAARGEMP